MAHAAYGGISQPTLSPFASAFLDREKRSCRRSTQGPSWQLGAAAATGIARYTSAWARQGSQTLTALLCVCRCGLEPVRSWFRVKSAWPSPSRSIASHFPPADSTHLLRSIPSFKPQLCWFVVHLIQRIPHWHPSVLLVIVYTTSSPFVIAEIPWTATTSVGKHLYIFCCLWAMLWSSFELLFSSTVEEPGDMKGLPEI